MLLCMLSILAFSNVDQVGYDPTFLCQYRSAVNLRKIQVAHSTYDIVKCIFYNFLIHGRGTSCWHVRFKKKDYVIKDSWIHASRVNRETDILEMIKDLRGVPRLIAAWTVEIGGSSDRTDIRRPIPLDTISSDVRIHRRILMEPVGIPLSEFGSIRELLSVLIDVLDSTSKSIAYFVYLTVFISSQSTLREVSYPPSRYERQQYHDVRL